MISFLSKRRGATLAGMFGLALGGLVLLCGAGSAPIENLLPQGAMQGDLNAGGHNLTNAATVYATNVVVSGSLTAPSSFSLPFSQLTGTPTTLSGYGITDPVVLTSGSYTNPTWLTGLAYSKLSGAPSLATVATSGSYTDLSNKPTIPVTTGTALLYGNGSGGFSNVTIGSNLTFSGGTLSASGGGGSGVSSFNTRTGAVTLSNSDVSNASVSGGTNSPVQIGTTTTSYNGTGSGGNSALEIQLDNTLSGSAIAPLNLTMDVVPPDNVAINPALGIQNAIFLHAGSNTTAAPGNVSATGFRATVTNRGTGNVNIIHGYETHLGNQTSSYGGGGTVATVVGYEADGPSTDASSPVGTATGILIDPQLQTNVTAGYGIDQEGASDINVFRAATDSIYGNFSLAGSGGTDLGIYASQKLGFYGTTPVIQPSGDLLTALGNSSGVGLVSSPTIGGNDVNPFVISANGGPIVNTTAASFISFGGNKGGYTFAANKLVVGSTYVLHMAGYYSTTGTPTLALIFGTYSSGLGTTFGTTGNLTMPASVTQYEWEADYEFTVQSTGASGTLIGQGWAHIQTGAGTVAVYPIENTATVTINTTASNSVLGFAQWGTAAAGNTITCTNANFRQIY